ncbi:sulfatase [Engelhardtia mirabilis]|uniref:Arylsulfatase n=1 Tax=Engelhardtia mirabilis TaxID=2528011 RepID=A0A518BIC3_9BACT|nr:Arylsulfatase [Planctomycetes bacterium Pla133]QDV01042.1 Arylsulfatase [Planctomycetes bacterium Pla86]
MSRRGEAPVVAVLAGLLALSLPACSAGDDPGAGRGPDIILISLDTVRADRLSCYGNPAETTPFLDRTAALGVRFEHAYSSAPHTAPSHMSLFTGLDPMAHGIPNKPAGRGELRMVNPGVPTLPEVLSANGYHTLGITDRGQLSPAMGFGRGFDETYFKYSKFDEKLDAFGDLVAEVPDDGAPLFVFFHSYECHAPYLPPLAVMRRFCDMEYRGEFRTRYDSLRRSPTGFLTTQAGRFLERFPGMGDEDLAWLQSLYDANLSFADSQVAELWRRWAELRDADNTVLMVVSDHGEGFGEHGFLGHPARLERELLRVPLIVRGPGVGVGVVDEPVPTSGLLATVLELIGIDAPSHAEPSFVDALRDPSRAPAPRALHQQLVGIPGDRRSDAVAVGGVRLLRRPGPEDVLFDFPGDPLEQSPLEAGEARLEPLREAISERRRVGMEFRDRFPAELADPDETDRADELEALGYIEGADER